MTNDIPKDPDHTLNRTFRLKELSELFFEETGKRIDDYAILHRQQSSPRRRVRLKSGTDVLIGTWNPLAEQNSAFVYLAEHLGRYGVHVPKVVATGGNGQLLLEEDLGDTSLYSLFAEKRTTTDLFPRVIEEWYERTIDALVLMQVKPVADLDFNRCYPTPAFDRQFVQWDLNYFKYNFLNLVGIPYNAFSLERDFLSFTDLILAAPCSYFMHRDFQSRNIMIKDNLPYIIDFQDGRRGPIHFDLTSLLYQPSVAIPEVARARLVEYYCNKMSVYLTFDRAEFKKTLSIFTFFRLFAASGTYGLRGIHERNPYFIKSITPAAQSLRSLLTTPGLPARLPELERVLNSYVERFANPQRTERNRLLVRISSFSYAGGVPPAEDEHGGGFVFDCRLLPNPGRDPAHAERTGLDKEVIQYLEIEPEVATFLSHVTSLVDASVNRYVSRKFSSLAVNFGCTGGRHRSVYCAEQIAAHLRLRGDIDVSVRHRTIGDTR